MSDSEDKGLGTFLGVFTPTVLTILGVIMYLRSGWVVSEAGVGGALAIVVIANVITFITALSMSSLATNMRVGVGGAYYLISRSVGLEVGGAIGIPLYLSQALSVTLYAFGLAAVAQGFVPEGFLGLSAMQVQQGLAAFIIVLVAVVASRSARLTLALQMPIMLLIGASLLSLVAGVTPGELQVPMFNDEGVGFWPVFAVFFPAVTGILAGVSLSGDLKDPGRSIPLGSLLAVVTGFLVYAALPLILGMARGPEALADEMVWTDIAVIPALVLPGMIGAILSSAFGSILGAPRTLQALSIDGLAPKAVGHIDEKSGEPVRAIFLTTAVALVAVLLGDLNAVAAVLTMFFLTTYATLNLVAGAEALVGDLSFRPRIRVPAFLSLAGAIGCVVAMVAIEPLAALVALCIQFGIYFFLSRRALQATWGDVRSGIWFTAARWALTGLSHTRAAPRNWRPHILLFAKDLERSLPLARFANDFGQRRGIVTVASLLTRGLEDYPLSHHLVRRNQALLDEQGIVAFPEVATVSDFELGVITFVQANGYAGLASNTVLFGWPDDAPALRRQLELAAKLEQLEKTVIVARLEATSRYTQRPKAVIWYGGTGINVDLMLLMGWLLRQSGHWAGLDITICSLVSSEADVAERKEAILNHFPDLRMEVSVDVSVAEQGTEMTAIIERSTSADLVFLGLPVTGDAEAVERWWELGSSLENVVFVRNASPFRGKLIS